MDTPERVRFRYRLAGPGRRGAAWILDGVARAVVLVVILVPVSLFSAVEELSGVGEGVFLLALFFLDWCYGALFETLMGGRTPGKAVLSLRVVRHDGSPGRLPDYVLRNLLRTVDFMPIGFAFGLVVMLVDGKLRRFGDLVAGTVVVVEERPRVLGSVAVEPPVTEVERQLLPPRVELSREELKTLEEFLRRRGRLSRERSEELAWLLGPVLSERTGVSADSWERVLVLAYARATGKDR